MDPIVSNEKPAMPLSNNTGQQEQSSPTLVGSPPIYDRDVAMTRLAEMSMPVDTHTMIANVDAVIADAMQTINDSLKRSSHYIDTARQQLMQQHPALKQAYDPNGSSKGTDSAHATAEDESMRPAATDANVLNQSALNQTALNEWDNDAYQSKVLSAHEIQQKQAMAKQAAICQAAAEMQQQLMAQQQAYQQHILSAALNASASITEQTKQEDDQHGPTMAQQAEQGPSSSEQDTNPSLMPAHKEN